MISPREEDTHFRVLRLLARNPQMTQRELAKALSLSLGATHYVLRALAQNGVIKIQNFRKSPRKLAYCYLLTPTGIAQKALLAKRFLARKSVEYEMLRAEMEAVRLETDHDAVPTGALKTVALIKAGGGIAGHEPS